MKTVWKVLKWICIVIVFVFMQTCIKAIVKANAGTPNNVSVSSYKDESPIKKGIEQDTERKLIMLVKELNKSLPQRMDDITTLQKVEKCAGREIRYYYTLQVSDDFKYTEEQKEIHRKSMANHVKYSDDFRLFRKQGVTMSYVYTKQNGEPLMFIRITPKDYQ